MTSSAELRTLFLDYFRDHGHEVVASSPLVPLNDTTLLFTNAGMLQFKDVSFAYPLPAQGTESNLRLGPWLLQRFSIAH